MGSAVEVAEIIIFSKTVRYFVKNLIAVMMYTKEKSGKLAER